MYGNGLVIDPTDAGGPDTSLLSVHSALVWLYDLLSILIRFLVARHVPHAIRIFFRFCE